ncbi:MAG: ABC transporter substrate-binding protein [Thermomicrobiales bacterium]|nr:ABC transporter substrate-binding protein [Thermomicrobiales bacterium]
MRSLVMVPRVGVLIAVLLAAFVAVASGPVRAQEASPAVNCAPAVKSVTIDGTPEPAPEKPGDLTNVRMGYVPVSIFAPVMIAQDKGYFAEEGINVELVPFPGGSDPVVLTATGDLDLSIAGAGPAFWNAVAQDLPITVIAPGHQEGNPVATPLMISKESCESGEISSVADLEGKTVTVNAPGATEYWLNAALSTGGLTINDVDVQALAFPDAVAALESGAIDAAMIGEPLATQAEQDGIAVRLVTDIPIEGVQPTVVFANDEWLANNPELAEAFATGYMRAVMDLSDNGFADPTNLAIIESYTGVPAALIAAAVSPVYATDGIVNVDALNSLQSFFRDRGLLEYDEDIDPATLIDQQYIFSALAEINPNQP